MRVLILVALAFTLAACGGGGNDNSNTDNNSNNNLEVIQWDRDPSNIIFRAQVMGGDDAEALYRRNEVPDCTVYGNGRVVWSLPVEAGSQVLFDTLDDVTIRRFITDLTVEQQIYTFDAEADLQVPSSSPPVYEQITVNVNDLSHTTDSLADWSQDYYTDIVSMCQGLGTAPTIYEPTQAWVSAVAAEYQDGKPIIFWDNAASGLNLQSLASSGERQWITNNNVRILWRLIRENSSDLIFADENGANYQVALEVPNVTVSSPPAQ